MITYGEDVQNLYNYLVRKDPMKFLTDSQNQPKALIVPPSGEWYILCNTKTKGGTLYAVSSVDALGAFGRKKTLGFDDLSRPVSDFTPRCYNVKSAALRNGILIHSWSWDHSSSNWEKVPLIQNRELTLEAQVRKLGETE